MSKRKCCFLSSTDKIESDSHNSRSSTIEAKMHDMPKPQFLTHSVEMEQPLSGAPIKEEEDFRLFNFFSTHKKVGLLAHPGDMAQCTVSLDGSWQTKQSFIN